MCDGLHESSESQTNNTNQDNTFFKRKRSYPGWDRQSALPTELPGQLSRQGSISLQHNARHRQTPNNSVCMVTQNDCLVSLPPSLSPVFTHFSDMMEKWDKLQAGFEEVDIQNVCTHAQ